MKALVHRPCVYRPRKRQTLLHGLTRLSKNEPGPASVLSRGVPKPPNTGRPSEFRCCRRRRCRGESTFATTPRKFKIAPKSRKLQSRVRENSACHHPDVFQNFSKDPAWTLGEVANCDATFAAEKPPRNACREFVTWREKVLLRQARGRARTHASTLARNARRAMSVIRACWPQLGDP